MDELATELGMSKKTLYQHFPAKRQLLREIVAATAREIRSRMEAILQKDAGFVEKLRQAMTVVGMQMSRISEAFVKDIRRNEPALWEEIDDWRRQSILTHFGRLIHEGAQRGALRPDLDPHLLVLMYATLVQRIVNPDTLSQLSMTPSQAFDSVIRVFFEGILTTEAREELGGPSAEPRNGDKR
jgi:AcrR family transcriptional regulator